MSDKKATATTTLLLIGFGLIVLAMVLYTVAVLVTNGVEAIADNWWYQRFIDLVKKAKDIGVV